MFKDVSKIYLASTICFILGLVFLMLNVLDDFFNILFSSLFTAGLVLIEIKQISEYKVFSEEIKNQKEGLVIDMVMSDDGSFGIADDKVTQKRFKEFKILKRERFVPIMVVTALAFIMAYFTIRMLINYFG